MICYFSMVVVVVAAAVLSLSMPLSLSFLLFHDRCHRVIMRRRLYHGLTMVFVGRSMSELPAG